MNFNQFETDSSLSCGEPMRVDTDAVREKCAGPKSS